MIVVNLCIAAERVLADRAGPLLAGQQCVVLALREVVLLPGRALTPLESFFVVRQVALTAI